MGGYVGSPLFRARLGQRYVGSPLRRARLGQRYAGSPLCRALLGQRSPSASRACGSTCPYIRFNFLYISVFGLVNEFYAYKGYSNLLLLYPFPAK